MSAHQKSAPSLSRHGEADDVQSCLPAESLAFAHFSFPHSSTGKCYVKSRRFPIPPKISLDGRLKHVGRPSFENVEEVSEELLGSKMLSKASIDQG